MRTANLFLSCILSFSMADSALADNTIAIEPGMWEFSSTMKSSMFPQVRTQTETQCIKLSEIGPDDLIPEEGGGDCTMTDTQVSGNSISWKMQCSGGAMHGHGQFKSNGDIPKEKANDLGIIVSVWLNPLVAKADDVDHKILFDIHRKAMASAIHKAMNNQPDIDWLLENQEAITHKYYQMGLDGKI